MRNKPVAIIVLLFFIGLLTSHANTKLLLVENSLPKCMILLSEQADPIEKHAAAELAHYIKKSSGAELKIGHQAEAGLPTLFLGTDPNDKLLGPQGFVIKTSAEQISIVGKKPIGVLYGVYDFLEEFLACRWLAPYPDCEFVPEHKNIAIETGIVKRENPAFEERVPYPTGGNAGGGKGARNTWDWTVRNKMQIVVPEVYYTSHHDFLRARGAIVKEGGHSTFMASVPDKKYFVSNPEYFCLVDGQRVMQKPTDVNYPDGGHTFAQICTSHPDVIRLCSEYIINFFDKYPDGIYLLGGGDGDAKWCECENCRRLDPPGITSVSTRFAVFANQVAERVLQAKPNANMEIWAYSIYRDPPIGVKLHPSLTVSLCPHGRSYKEPLNSADYPINEKYMRLFTDWQKQASRIIMREYVGCGSPSCHPSWDALALDLRAYRQNKEVIGWFDEVDAPDATYAGKFSTPFRRRSWRARWQYLFLAAKMTWNPDIDHRQLLREARKVYYGSAAPVMEKYFGTLEEAWKKTSGAIGWSVTNSKATVARTIAQPGVQAKLADLLQEAVAASGENAVDADKIKQELDFFEHYWVQNLREYRERQKPALMAHRANSPVKISGQGDDTQWRLAETIVDFRTPENLVPKYATGVKILYDADNFYFLIESIEPETGQLVMRSRPRDGQVWEDDDVEIFLYAPDLRQQVYWQFAFNPLGSLFDSKWRPGMNGDIAFNADVEVKTAILPDRWFAEVRIPVAAMSGKLCDGSRWKINVARSRKAKEGDETGEISSLSASAFHDFEGFRDFTLGKPLLRNGSFIDLKPYDGKRPASIDGDEPGKFPAHWGISTMRGSLKKTSSGHIVQFSPGAIYTYIGNIPAQGIIVNIEASGTGRLDARFRCWTAKKSINKNPERIDDRFRKTCDSVALTEEKQLFQFEYMPEENNEEGYLYIYVLDGDAAISNVSALIKNAANDK